MMIEISTDKSKLDIALIHKFISEESYWGKGIPINTLIIFTNFSLCFGAYLNKRPIGFARIISAKQPYLADVLIKELSRLWVFKNIIE